MPQALTKSPRLRSVLLAGVIAAVASGLGAQTSDSLRVRPVFDATAADDTGVDDTGRGLTAFLRPADTFSRKRFYTSAGIATGMYAALSVGLYTAWYEDSEARGFRTIDDTREWEGMDKLGHVYTTYSYAAYANQGLEWSGVPKRKRLILSAATSMVLQSTVEVFDGLSPDWGFSWADMGANALGAGVFVVQEGLWDEQRVFMKFSASRHPHPHTPVPAVNDGGAPTSRAARATELYGESRWTRFLKDYGGQTIWLSANPGVLAGRGERARWPWLMLSVGYSPENVYGAYANRWRESPDRWDLEPVAPRSRQFITSIDVDLTRIPTKDRALKTVLFLANIFKAPAPALLYDTNAGLQWRWLYF